jgi:hypothetical protein
MTSRPRRSTEDAGRGQPAGRAPISRYAGSNPAVGSTPDAPVERKPIRMTPAWWEHIRRGEIFPWKGLTCRVEAVGPAGILLRVTNVNIRRLARHGDVRMVEVPSE